MEGPAVARSGEGKVLKRSRRDSMVRDTASEMSTRS